MFKDKKVYAVLLAAGNGTRMGKEEKKQFLEMKGKPLFYYAFETFSAHPAVDGVILVTAESDIFYMKELLMAALQESEKDTAYMMDKLKTIVPGGIERYDSVRNAMSYLDNAKQCDQMKEDSIVLIHDGARPFVSAEIIDRVLEKAVDNAVVPAVAVKDTICVADGEGKVESTLDRSKLYAVQTPQGFPYPLLRAAYEKWEAEKNAGKSELKVTDDAMLVEHYLKRKTCFVEGSYKNMKLTTEEDLLLSEYYLEKGMV